MFFMFIVKYLMMSYNSGAMLSYVGSTNKIFVINSYSDIEVISRINFLSKN